MTETPDSLIPYDEIVQEALRAVVGRVLGQIESGGGTLPGNHHFYITFKTGAPGVSIPTHLKERFPDEMTIVLQNKFWDLNVADDRFSVGLSFNQVPAKLDIPYSAITAFVDPAVDFGLQFQATVADLAPEPHEDAENDSPDGGAAPAVTSEDGSNVVTVDFGRKK
ncbi:MAG: SspB family protein [Novosphingobium sp.]